MKKLASLLLPIAFALITNYSFSQKIKTVDGDLNFLKKVTQLNVTYDYSDMAVGKFKNENDYIGKKVKDYNKKEAGTGDTWKEAWYGDREKTYEPKFEELVNKQFDSRKVDLEIGDFPDAEYTLILKTTFTEPGFNVGITRKNAEINCEAIFVETANENNVLSIVTIKKAPGRGGMGYDFDVEFRIGEAYAKAGKELAYYIWKNYLK